MNLFGWKGASSSRRSNRLWLLRLKRFGIAMAAVCILVSLAGYGWTSGFFSRAGSVIHDKTMAFTGSIGFKVDEILVTGRDNIPQDELLMHLGIERGSPIFAVPLEEAQAELAQISWIKQVSISRRLPGNIHVDITERAPVALWQSKKKISAIDAEGKILSGGSLGRYKSLPLIVGDGAPEKVSEIVALLKAEPGIAENLASAVRIGDRRWDLHLKNNIVVKLPENDVELALAKLAAAVDKDGIFGKDITVIDLRLAERMVLGVNPVADKKEEKNSI